MIRAVVDYALRNRLLVLALGILLLAWGAISFKNLPVEAYPDVANNYVQIITQWPGRAAEEVEQQVTIPLEVILNGIPQMTSLRSVSEFGLSLVTMIFDDSSVNDVNRQKVLERLSMVTPPSGLQPTIGPDYSPVGQLFWYTLRSTNPEYDLMELKSIEDWQLEKQFKSVPDVIDVSSFGGLTREYQVRVDPNKLVSYGLSIGQVEQALTNNNLNAGGSFIEEGQQQVNVRAVGLFADSSQIGSTVLTAKNGTPVRVKDIAEVAQGPKIRLGQIGKAIHRVNGAIVDDPDVVEGIVLLRKGGNTEEMLEGVHAKVKELNNGILAAGSEGGSFPRSQRSGSLHHAHGDAQPYRRHRPGRHHLVFVPGQCPWRAYCLAHHPFSLLFASICLDLNKIPANLLSLGALDFGMVVDGAVVMVENILRHMGRREAVEKSPMDRIREAAREVQRPVFYAIAIIITAYLPIFTLQRVEGRLFRPMALTVSFALLGALIFSMLLAPVLSTLLFRKNATEWHNPVLVLLTSTYRRLLHRAIHARLVVFGTVAILLSVSLWLAISGKIGSEFLPHLDEGAIWARGTLAPSTGPTDGERIMRKARLIFASFPEVTQVVSQVGRPDDGTDSALFANTEYFMDLNLRRNGGRFSTKTKRNLFAPWIAKGKNPGRSMEFLAAHRRQHGRGGQRRQGRVGDQGLRNDLKVLEEKGDEIVSTMRNIPGIQDLGLFPRHRAAESERHGRPPAAAATASNVSDIQDAIQTAVGGNAVSQVLKGEQRYDLVVRYLPAYRSDAGGHRDIRLLAPSGERVSLGQLRNIQMQRRSLADLSRKQYPLRRHQVQRARPRSRKHRRRSDETVDRKMKLPAGYHLEWAGEYASANAPTRGWRLIVPVTSPSYSFCCIPCSSRSNGPARHGHRRFPYWRSVCALFHRNAL